MSEELVEAIERVVAVASAEYGLDEEEARQLHDGLLKVASGEVVV